MRLADSLSVVVGVRGKEQLVCRPGTKGGSRSF
jgi:hypothetical protein